MNMKTMMIGFAFFILAIQGSSQEITPDLQLTSEQYLKKSKNQKTTAWVLLGAGTTAIVGGVAVSSVNPDDLTRALNTVFNGAPLMLLGLTLDVISIPVFIAADKNKKKAMEAVTTIKFEEVPSWSGGAVRQSGVPTISVNIKF
jgi:cytosine/uracil/thiamine/allantoin permease